MPLLERLNAPEMTEHLGGPENPEQLEARLKLYVAAAESSTSYTYKAILDPDGTQVGVVNFWDRDWNGGPVYEMGWSVIPEYQGRGIASTAVALAIDLARATSRRTAVHAFPSAENGPSNSVCRKAGFTLLGEVPFEYPKGHWMRCNDWRFLLREYT